MQVWFRDQAYLNILYIYIDLVWNGDSAEILKIVEAFSYAENSSGDLTGMMFLPVVFAMQDAFSFRTQ